MQFDWPLKRILLRMFVGTLILSALIGIYCVLFGSFGQTEVKILLTTLTVSYFSVTSLACAAALDKQRSPLLIWPGFGTGILGFFVFNRLIWFGHPSDELVKFAFIVGIFSFAFAHACLVSLPTLKPNVRWVFYFALAASFGLAGLLSLIILQQRENEWLFRFSGVLGILDCCATVSIPVLARLGNQPKYSPQGLTSIELQCPRCGERGKYTLGEITCRECSLKMRVEVEE